MTFNRKKKNTVIIVAAILLSIVGIIWLGVSIPASMSDGTEKFNGDELAAAEQALQETKERYRSSMEKVSAVGTFQYRVEAVRGLPNPASGVFSQCRKFYQVEVSRIGLFGTVGVVDSPYVCLR